MSGTVILIGGGNFEKNETLSIDTYALKLCAKPKPNVLIIPAAMQDDQGYGKRLKQYFRRLGAEASALRLLHTKLDQSQVHQMFRNADIIYLGAGSTKLLMDTIDKWNLADILKQAYESGAVLMGISAGANVLCEYGYSDVEPGRFEFVKGIGLLPYVFTPHANQKERAGFFEEAGQYLFEMIAAKDLEAIYIKKKQICV